MVNFINSASTIYMGANAAQNLWNVWKKMNATSLLDEEKKRNPQGNPFRPPQWGSQPKEMAQLVLVRPNIAYNDLSKKLYGYFFDAIIREEHTTELVMTKHPVQNGAPISDHAYMLPARLVLEIGVSDVMAGFYKSQFTRGATKSISAFMILRELQSKIVPLQVCTRMGIYKNMLICREITPVDNTTANSLKMTVHMEQIFSAAVETVKISVRPQTTDSTKKGPVAPLSLSLDTSSLLSRVKLPSLPSLPKLPSLP